MIMDGMVFRVAIGVMISDLLITGVAGGVLRNPLIWKTTHGIVICTIPIAIYTVGTEVRMSDIQSVA